jgi:ribosomal-protein-alanine N-acetyltransferase
LGASRSGHARVEAWVEPENVASQSLLTAAGFTREGVLRSFLAYPTRRADAVVFSRIAHDR